MYASCNIMNRSEFAVQLHVLFSFLPVCICVVMSLLGLIVIEMRYKCIFHYRLCTTKNTESLLQFFWNLNFLCVYFVCVIVPSYKISVWDLADSATTHQTNHNNYLHIHFSVKNCYGLTDYLVTQVGDSAQEKRCGEYDTVISRYGVPVRDIKCPSPALHRIFCRGVRAILSDYRVVAVA
jgi:hypothetical protein